MNNTKQEIQNNLYAYYDQVAQCQGIYSEKEERWSMIRNQPGTWPRLIYRVSQELPQGESSDKLFEKVQSGQYPEVLIATDDNIRQTDPYLRARGFYPYLGWKGMALEPGGQILPPEIPETIQIVTLDLSQDRQQWAKIVSTELIAPTLFDPALLDSLIIQPGVEIYLLKYLGTGVSTLLVFPTEHSTGIYMLATSRSAQRKGFAQLLLQQIIWQIAQKSKKPIILHATQKGEGLYAKLGFLPYNQFFLYRYLKPQP